MLGNILRTTKCANSTPLSILVDDDKRMKLININIRYIWYYSMQYCVLINARSRINADQSNIPRGFRSPCSNNRQGRLLEVLRYKPYITCHYCILFYFIYNLLM